jgi:long-chain acyl-CoA synthetase
VSGVEIKISDEQEILIRGESISQAITRTLRRPIRLSESWFHTGDSGYINEKNHLFYLDRIDNLDELSNGLKYAPAYIEGKLKFSRFIQDVMVVGGKNRNYLGNHQYRF